MAIDIGTPPPPKAPPPQPKINAAFLQAHRNRAEGLGDPPQKAAPSGVKGSPPRMPPPTGPQSIAPGAPRTMGPPPAGMAGNGVRGPMAPGGFAGANFTGAPGGRPPPGGSIAPGAPRTMGAGAALGAMAGGAGMMGPPQLGAKPMPPMGQPMAPPGGMSGGAFGMKPQAPRQPAPFGAPTKAATSFGQARPFAGNTSGGVGSRGNR